MKDHLRKAGLAGCLLLAVVAGCHKKSAPKTGPVQPWETVDDGFRGCEGG